MKKKSMDALIFFLSLLKSKSFWQNLLAMCIVCGSSLFFGYGWAIAEHGKFETRISENSMITKDYAVTQEKLENLDQNTRDLKKAVETLNGHLYDILKRDKPGT